MIALKKDIKEITKTRILPKKYSIITNKMKEEDEQLKQFDMEL